MDDAAENAAVTNRRGKWSEQSVPHKGWNCVSQFDVKDSGGELIICEMCETMEVRFVHVMEHERYSGSLNCGCICSAHMSGEAGAAIRRDKQMRSRARRRSHFHKRRGWKISQSGTPHITVDGYHMMVGKNADGTFGVAAKSPRDTDHTWGTKKYESETQAKAGCFDALEFLVERRRKSLLLAAVIVV